MNKIFVNRQPIIEKFHKVLQDDDSQGILIIGGVSGIGKTTVLKHLRSHCPPDVLIVADISFASSSLRNDHLSLLDILEHELTAHFQDLASSHTPDPASKRAPQQKHTSQSTSQDAPLDKLYQDLEVYKQCRQEAQKSFESERERNINVVHEIRVEKGGSIYAEKIIQKTTIDLSKALYKQMIHTRNDLTSKLVRIVGTYLEKSEVRMIMFVDDLDELQSVVEGEECADWFLIQLIGGIRRLAPNQLRVIISDLGSLRWLKSIQGQAVLRHPLKNLSREHTFQYLREWSVDVKLQEAIYELTQGHPLCVGLATDLCRIDSNLTVSGIKELAFDSFDSEALAYRLFQKTVDYEPDEARKRFLRHGPVFRVIDDEVMRQVLAPELDFVGREDELLRSLKDISCVEQATDVKEPTSFSFKPIIRERHSEELRRKAAADDTYKAINRRALRMYTNQARQTQSEKDRQAYERDALCHLFNLEPRLSRRRWQTRVNEAALNFDYQGSAVLLDLAQSTDFGWSSKDTSGFDKGTIKMRESLHYRMTGRDEQAEISRRKADEFFDNSKTRGCLELFSQAYHIIVRGPRYVVVLLYTGTKSIIDWYTSPVRQLERYLRKLKRIVKRLDQMNRQVVNTHIPKIQQVRADAIQLQIQIEDSIFHNIRTTANSNQSLAGDIQNALGGRDAFGRIAPLEFNNISTGIQNANMATNNLNAELANLRTALNQHSNTVSQAAQLYTRLEEELKNLSQDRLKLIVAAKAVQTKLTMAELSSKEMRRIEEIGADIDEHAQQGASFERDLNANLVQYNNVSIQAVNALNELDSAIHNVKEAIGEVNRFIAGFDGIELACTDGRVTRITVERQ